MTYPARGEALREEHLSQKHDGYDVFYRPHIMMSDRTGGYLMEWYKTEAEANAAADEKIKELKGN